MAAEGPRLKDAIFRAMKRLGLIALHFAATLFLLLVPRTVPAAPAPKMNPAEKAAKRSAELLQRFDRNGDGRIDDDERTAAKEEMMQDQLDRQMARISAGSAGGTERFRAQALELFDKNKDGRLDDDERAEAQRFAEARRDPTGAIDEVTRRFDKNGDGRLDADERGQAEAFLTELRAYGASRMRSELLRQFDRNADGKIDDAEMAELEKTVRPRLESSPQQRRQYDTDRNQKIDAAEWKVARSRLMNWLNGNGPAALEGEFPRADKARK